jgi:hypothetical protein
MTTQERFAADHGLPMVAVERIIRTADYCKAANEHVCNGDPHPWSKDKTDKAANARAWEETAHGHTQDLLAAVRPYGFTGVEYTGLRPTLKKGTQYIEIPG